MLTRHPGRATLRHRNGRWRGQTKLVSHALTNEFLFLLQQLLSLEGNRGEHVSACARARERGRQGDRAMGRQRVVFWATSSSAHLCRGPHSCHPVPSQHLERLCRRPQGPAIGRFRPHSCVLTSPSPLLPARLCPGPVGWRYLRWGFLHLGLHALDRSVQPRSGIRARGHRPWQTISIP